MPDPRPVGLDLPDGLPPWLAGFVPEAQRETDALRGNGAQHAAAARTVDPVSAADPDEVARAGMREHGA